MKELSGSKLLMIAVICGVVAAGLSMLYLKQVESKYRNANKAKQEIKISVVVAGRDIRKGETIAQENISAFKVPKKYLPANAVQAKDWKNLANRTIQSSAARGQVLTWDAFSGSARKTFSENVELGRRAITLKVNKINSFDGLLRPGDHIDLFGNFTSNEIGLTTGKTQGASDVSLPILENVEVLAAGREDLTGRKWEKYFDNASSDGFNMSFTTVTLNLSPRQAGKVKVAEQIGEIVAILRHPKDTSLSQIEYIDVSVLTQPDPIETVDLVMGADGKPLGKVVGDNIVDADGNIIGKIVDGKPVTFDGKPMGVIAKNVNPDDPALRITEHADVVRDANGNVIGKIVNGQIIDANGNVIGKVGVDGKPMGLDGKILGTIEKNVALDKNGNVVDLSKSKVSRKKGKATQVVRDANGNVIGRIVDGKVVDENGNVIGKVAADGSVMGLDGKVLGKVETVMMDKDGNIVGETAQVVRDADGNVIGRIVDGKVVDENGKVIGTVKDGQIVDNNGQVIASGISVETEDALAAEQALDEKKAAKQITVSHLVDFIGGGTGEDGLLSVKRVRKE